MEILNTIWVPDSFIRIFFVIILGIFPFIAYLTFALRSFKHGLEKLEAERKYGKAWALLSKEEREGLALKNQLTLNLLPTLGYTFLFLVCLVDLGITLAIVLFVITLLVIFAPIHLVIRYAFYLIGSLLLGKMLVDRLIRNLRKFVK